MKRQTDNSLKRGISFIAAAALTLGLCACGGTQQPQQTQSQPQESQPAQAREITIYTAVDQVYSEQIFAEFEEETGIQVNAVYDIESNKTTGLTNKILAPSSCRTPGPCSPTFLRWRRTSRTPTRTPRATGPPSAVAPGRCL